MAADSGLGVRYGAVAVARALTARRTVASAAAVSSLLVGAAVLWNLVNLRSETFAVPYLNDSSVHEQMVRFATLQLRAGHFPLTSWFPYLGLGSPQFLHYQSLPAVLTGLVGLVIGPNAAFRWSLYLLLSLWPVSVYLGARLLGLERRAAVAAAVMSPFLMSVTAVGYEQKAYVWIGYGVWAQLWASLTLPLAWGFTWRALRDGRQYLPAVVLISITIAFHFETGYLAILPLFLWPWVARGQFAARLRRAALVGVGTLLVSAWVIVPLIEERAWAATNQVLQHTGPVNGYGVGTVLRWLASGQMLDARRIPVLTLLAGFGVAVAGVRSWRRDQTSRALLLILAGCLVLSFGRTTLGPLASLIPGSKDIFFRRFMMGDQLVALLLAGVGASWCWRRAWAYATKLARRSAPGLAPDVANRLLEAGIAVIAMVAVLSPAWLQLRAFDEANAATIAVQQRADRSQAPRLDRLLNFIRLHGGGRVYAGMPSNWGMRFTIGAVPVFKYLESRDVDEVGYTLRTASLMTVPEYYFDQHNPGDYGLFGIRYLILPSRSRPAVRARSVMRSGPYALWTVAAGYLRAGRIVGTIAETRTNLGTQSISLLRSRLPSSAAYLAVAFSGRTAPANGRLQTGRGVVLTSRDNLTAGSADATIRMRQRGIVVLSASYDPGWHATVDGRPSPTRMVAPALVATVMPAGQHRVTFRFSGFASYPELFGIALAALGALLAVDLTKQKGSRDRLRRTLVTTKIAEGRNRVALVSAQRARGKQGGYSGY